MQTAAAEAVRLPIPVAALVAVAVVDEDGLPQIEGTDPTILVCQIDDLHYFQTHLMRLFLL